MKEPGNVKNDDINLQADTLTDLPVADEIKGGALNRATGDVNDDGFDDIIVGAGPGAGPHVK